MVQSTIRRILKNNGVHSRVTEQEGKKNISALLQFAQGHLKKTEGYWKNVLWTDETKAGPSAAQQKGITEQDNDQDNV